MSLVVQKYGGTSVGTLDRIRRVAERVADTYRDGHQVIVVVSAMAGETDRLLGLGWELSNGPAEREMDVLVSSGEQVSAALLAIQLNEIGVPARSMLGHQARILTDNVHRKARIRTIDGTGLRSSLATGNVLVVAGFQGTDAYGNITTLGRGGSDTSAVAIAAAVKADVCEICTDVDGVYTTDPGVCPNARKIKCISYEEMGDARALLTRGQGPTDTFGGACDEAPHAAARALEFLERGRNDRDRRRTPARKSHCGRRGG
jgi:aspartate kinase